MFPTCHPALRSAMCANRREKKPSAHSSLTNETLMLHSAQTLGLLPLAMLSKPRQARCLKQRHFLKVRRQMMQHLQPKKTPSETRLSCDTH